MQLDELTSLIQIRNYVINAIGIPTIEKTKVNELNGILLLLDKKIIDLLTGVDFKEYIGYKNVQAAKEAAARVTNIYSGIDNKNLNLHKQIRQK